MILSLKHSRPLDMNGNSIPKTESMALQPEQTILSPLKPYTTSVQSIDSRGNDNEIDEYHEVLAISKEIGH